MFKLNDKNKLLTATAISMLGSSMSSIVLSLYVYSITLRVFNISLILLISYIPSLIFGNISGNVIKIIGEKRAMFISDIINSILMIILIFNNNNLTVIYILTFFEGVMSLIFFPSRSSIVANISDNNKEMQKINSLLSSIRSFTSIVGPILGTSLICILQPKDIFLIDGISFLVSAILIISMKIEHCIAADVQEEKKYFKISKFVGMCKSSNLFSSITAITFFNMVGFGVINVTLIDYCKKYADLSDSQYGNIISAYAIGALLSSLIVYKINITKKRIQILYISVFLLGVDYILLSYLNNFYVLLVLRFFIGALTVVIDVFRESILQQKYSKDILPNIFSILWSIGSAGSVISIVSVGILSDYISSNTIIRTSGVPFILIILFFVIKYGLKHNCKLDFFNKEFE